jgi:hypothetical protein
MTDSCLLIIENPATLIKKDLPRLGANERGYSEFH